MRKIILIGLVLGFALKMLEVNLPRFPGPTNASLFHTPGWGFNFVGNDAIHSALWILIAIFIGPIGWWGLAGFSLHQAIWYGVKPGFSNFLQR